MRRLASGFVCFAIATLAAAQEYPSRPLRLLVGFAAGSTGDIIARLVSVQLADRLGQPLVVENRVGGTGVIAYDAVSKSTPDGYTLGIIAGGHATGAATMKKLPYDPVAGFGWISMIVDYPLVIGVAPEAPIKSLADLFARAKAAPGKVSFVSVGFGSIHHLLGEWLNIEAGTTMINVPFKGESPGLVEVIAGRVDVMLATTTFASAPIKAGKLRPLALTAPTRYALAPDIALVNETLPGFELVSWQGIATAPGTPRAIVDRLNREIVALLATPAMREKLADLGGVPAPLTPEAMRARIERDIARWTKVVEAKGLERQ